MYKSEVLADSISPDGVRIVTILAEFPRYILAEMNTHKLFSRNAASSRAIPVLRRVADCETDPFVPEAFHANKPGMSAGDPLEEAAANLADEVWRNAASLACSGARALAEAGVHKQWANRLIEPFSWIKQIITSTEWDNFRHLRVSPHAQPEMRKIAAAMMDSIDASTPVLLRPGEWHLPLVRDEDFEEANSLTLSSDAYWAILLKLSAGRCARVSYLTHDGRRAPEADISLHDGLLDNGHMSPFEHQALPFSAEEVGLVRDVQNLLRNSRPASWTPALLANVVREAEFRGNFRMWTQYRKTIPGEFDRLAPPLPGGAE